MPNTPGGQHIGLGRKILGAAIEGASYLMPPAVPLGHMLGQKLSQGDYPQKRAAYEQEMAQAAAQSSLEKERAAAEETRQRGKLYGQQADTMAAEGKMRPVVSKDGTVIDPRTGQPIYSPVKPLAARIKEYTDAGYAPDEARILAAGGKGSDLVSKPIKTLEQRAVEILSDDTIPAAQKEVQLKQIGAAHNMLHPQAPIHGFETDAKGNVTLMVADPANPAAVQKVPVGQIGKPQQQPASLGLGELLKNNPDALDIAAAKYEQTGVMPSLGRTGTGAVLVLKRVAERQKAAGISPEQTGINTEIFKANKTAMADITKREAQIGAMEKTAGKNLDVFMSEAQKLADTGVPILNEVFRGGERKLTGGLGGFDAARITAFTEISRVLSGSMSGTLSDSSRHEAESILKGDYTTADLMRAAKVLRTDMRNRMESITDEKRRLQQEMGGSPPTQAPNPDTPPAAKAATMDDIRAYVKAHPGMSESGAKKIFTDKGYAITGR